MSTDWNPENLLNQVLDKQQFYVINSVLIPNKVLDCDELNGHLLFLNERKDERESQQFALVKKQNGYLIQSKFGGYLTIFKDGNLSKIYLDKNLKEQSAQLFKISSKIGMKGQRIETLDKKAIVTLRENSDKSNWKNLVLSEENSQQNQLWNFSDPTAQTHFSPKEPPIEQGIHFTNPTKIN